VGKRKDVYSLDLGARKTVESASWKGRTSVRMAPLEDLTRGATVKGILPDRLVTVVDVQWLRENAIRNCA
jgi:hypothetical protein